MKPYQNHIICFLLTLVLWPIGIIIFFMGLRKSLARRSKRLNLPGSVIFIGLIKKWIYGAERFFRLGSKFWFVDRPKPWRPRTETDWQGFRDDQEKLNQRLKTEFGIE